MKKGLVFLMAMALFLSFAGLASANGDNPIMGSYSLESVSITPPAGGVTWDASNPANLVVGTTYSVAMGVEYTQDSTDQDYFYNTLDATITFNNSNLTFSDDDNYGEDGYDYDFFFDIAVTEDMLNDTLATVTFQGTDIELCWHDLSAAFTLPVDVAPVPEPSTLLLLGAGLVGLVGYSRRKKE